MSAAVDDDFDMYLNGETVTQLTPALLESCKAFTVGVWVRYTSDNGIFLTVSHSE